MVFTSLEFLTLFLPLFFIVYAAAPRSWRNGVLLLFSWIFYGWWSPAYLLLFIGLIVLSWAGGLALGAAAMRRWSKAWLALLIAVNASVLFWFKYANVVVETYSHASMLAGAMPLEWQRVALPIGLSFIILQAISYLVDVYRGQVRPQRSFIDYGAYLSMFGQLIAGPILRYEWVRRELADRSLNWSDFSLGARRFMVGMSMKVLVADTLSPIVDTAFSLPDPGFLDAWMGCGAYSLQLFFDFAGYSAMAIGLGQMLGFHFPENFNHPYLAASIQDFWRRWHISLSGWIRDYLYVPLGGNRLGTGRTYFNLMVTMAIAGMWHGSDNWNFLLWGIAHGLALCAARAWRTRAMPPIPGWLSRAATLLFVCMAWVVFRAPDFQTALSLYAAQLGMRGLEMGDALRVALQPSHCLAAWLGLACILAPALPRRFFERLPAALRAAFSLWPLAGFLLSFALIVSRGAVPFLYFQF
ncbi:MBOAT family O-acyltransferase [Parapusillimonas granuli]|uniref:Probable alginate O-acetylase AlgI n=1 Tax=Parapusillimonas granuli TaxID=380911 RepID=A0A853G0N7_9BURK|nr:MBOAT family protein [Parapusillimonas granuli]MBB5216309.1 alginate O-acetyltransferase complex protein AlgI [Parapusillimonas granuli]MEB2401668.1 MBOAT family protein [Alcaligenaceae bacterium]NYT47986.1 MBOAT family protein [Parapusillimonas granuli]